MPLTSEALAEVKALALRHNSMRSAHDELEGIAMQYREKQYLVRGAFRVELQRKKDEEQ